MRICFATNNEHKVKEVQALLGPEFLLTSLQQIGCTEELAEDGDSLEANSRQKAEYVFTTYHIPCFADDSGLVVAALGGAPGVDSAHYAGKQRSSVDNIDLLLKNLAGATDRKAQFETVITLAEPAGIHQFKGVATGRISPEPAGNGGFGYDPVFIPDGFSNTFAEMTPGEKNAISHRARAVHKLVEFLKSRRVLVTPHE